MRFPAVIRVLIIAAAAAGGGFFWGHSRPAPPLPDVVMVVIDTLRWDRLGCYGDPLATTRFLDWTAASGVLVKNAYAPSSWTMPSVASLFTSRYPSQHHVNDLDLKLSSKEVTLAERLSRAGYRTAGFTANWRLSDANGFHQGFDHWEPLFPDLGKSEKTRGATLNEAVVTWLDEWKEEKTGQRQPYFLYVQYIEPHGPLQPPPEFRQQYDAGVSDEELDRINKQSLELSPLVSKGLTPAQARVLDTVYRAEVASVDRAIEKLFQELESRRLLKKALIVITSDHGEEFLEHGAVGHGFDLHDETVRIPMIFAGRLLQPGVIEQAVSLVDLAPTVLDLAGIAPDVRFEGTSWASLLAKGRWSRFLRWSGLSQQPDVVLQLLQNNAATDLRTHELGIVRGSDKLLVTPRGAMSLYDLARDPAERTPVVADDKRIRLRSGLTSRMNEFARKDVRTPERILLDEATRERLRAMGYHQ